MRISLPLSSQFSNISSWNATKLAGAAINLIMVVSAVICFFQLLLGGLKFIIAAGDKEKTHAATRRIFHSLIGLVIVFGTYVLVGLASDFLGVPLLQFTIISV